MFVAFPFRCGVGVVLACGGVARCLWRSLSFPHLLSPAGKIDVSFFDLTQEPVSRAHHGAKVVSEAELRRMCGVAWASTSSAGAPEARVVSGGQDPGGGEGTEERLGLLCATSVCRDPRGSMLCAGYEDGAARVFRYPAYTAGSVGADGSGCITINLHRTGPVHATFTAPLAGGGTRLVTVGENDGALLVWDVQ